MSAGPSGSAPVRLDFKEKLLEKGKRDTGEVLLRKLKTLHTKLAALEQDHVEVKSLDPVRKPLIDNLILHHKDKGVRAYAACCLADLLRLYAPDAPYVANELRDIFQFFCAQLTEHLRVGPTARPIQASRSKTNGAQAQAQETQTQLSQRITDAAYYTEYCYLLESLATIKSVVLACDVPGGEQIVTSFFEGFVKIVRSDMSKTVIRHMSQILIALLEESSTIPQGVMDVIVDQFTNHARLDIPSFSMIVDVCNGAAVRLHRPIYSHFAEVQLSHGRNPTSEDMNAITESHALLLTIWNYSPDVLPMVIPILEENLRAADQTELRNLTTRTLARMFGCRPRVGMTVADLAKAFSGTWKAWLGRQLDKSTQVRLTWAESSIEILANVPDLRKEMEVALVDRIQDSNEQVRAAICKVFGELDFETTLHQISVHTLRAIGDRMSDKKAVVRNEAVSTLSKLWDAARTEIGEEQDEAVVHFAWIPQAIFHCLQIKDLPVDGRTALTSALKTRILPLPAKPDDEQAWVEQLLLVASRLDDQGMAGLAKATGLPGYARGSSPYKAFVAFCEDNNGGIIDKDEELVKARLAFVINAIAITLFSDAEKAKRDMQEFAAVNDNRLYKLLKTCTAPVTDLRSLVKARNEFLRRIEQQHTGLLETFTTIIENGSFNVVNTTSISHLLRAVQSPSGPRREQVGAAAFKLLALVAKECPPMYASHVPELLVCMGQKKNDKLVEVALQSLAAVCKYDRDLAPKDNKNVDKVIQIALTGTPRQAKFAARFLSVCGHEDAPARLVDDILDQLAEKNQDLLLTHLRGLTELALSSPQAVETKADEIHRYVMAEVIYKQSDSSDDTAEDEWTEEENLSIIDRAKIIALRLVTHRAIGFARDPEALKVANPVFSLLDGILKNEGQVTQDTKEGGHAKTQIRLRAALCLIKLAQVRSFDKRMTRFFEPISYIMQDPCYQVRNRLLIKLAEILPAQRMLARWNVMPAMIATDPEKDNPALAKSIITSCIKSSAHIPSAERIERIEMPLSRLLLVLAHHPDLEEWTISTLKDMATYVDLYLDCVLNRDNAGLLYHVAGKLKSVKGLDANGEPDEDNTNLYKLAELTQIIIKNKAELHKWTIQTYPGKVKLPRDIFHNLQNTQVTVENTRRTYLTEEESNWAKGLGRRGNAAAGPSRRLAEPGSSPVRKRPKSGQPAARKRSRRTNETSDEDDDEDEEDEDEEESDEDMESEESAEEGGGGEEIVGRGGKRGAKTKAKRGLKGKKKVKGEARKKRSKSASADAMDVDDDSDLSDAPGA